MSEFDRVVFTPFCASLGSLIYDQTITYTDFVSFSITCKEAYSNYRHNMTVSYKSDGMEKISYIFDGKLVHGTYETLRNYNPEGLVYVFNRGKYWFGQEIQTIAYALTSETYVIRIHSNDVTLYYFEGPQFILGDSFDDFLTFIHCASTFEYDLFIMVDPIEPGKTRTAKAIAFGTWVAGTYEDEQFRVVGLNYSGRFIITNKYNEIRSLL